MTGQIALSAPHRTLVLAILRAHAPTGTKVLVFGSRAAGTARRYSDLDLAIDASRPLTLHETGALAEAFSESDLPWKVDLIDLHSVSEQFRQTVLRDAVELRRAQRKQGQGALSPMLSKRGPPLG